MIFGDSEALGGLEAFGGLQVIEGFGAFGDNEALAGLEAFGDLGTMEVQRSNMWAELLGEHSALEAWKISGSCILAHSGLVFEDFDPRTWT